MQSKAWQWQPRRSAHCSAYNFSSSKPTAPWASSPCSFDGLFSFAPPPIFFFIFYCTLYLISFVLSLLCASFAWPGVFILLPDLSLVFSWMLVVHPCRLICRFFVSLISFVRALPRLDHLAQPVFVFFFSFVSSPPSSPCVFPLPVGAAALP